MNEIDVVCPILPPRAMNTNNEPIPEIPEGEPVYNVPPEFRAVLREIILKRREVNNPNGVRHESYYRTAAHIQERLTTTVELIRTAVGLPNEAIIEFHSGWRYTVTSPEKERLRYEAASAKKNPETRINGGPTDEFLRRWPEPPCHLWRYMFARDEETHKIAYSLATKGRTRSSSV